MITQENPKARAGRNPVREARISLNVMLMVDQRFDVILLRLWMTLVKP